MRAFLKAGQEMGKTGIERQRQRDFERVNIAFRLETMVRTGVRWVFDTPFAERAALREIVRERLGGIAIEDEAALEEDAAYGAPDMESDLEFNEDTASLVAEIGGPDVVANAISAADAVANAAAGGGDEDEDGNAAAAVSAAVAAAAASLATQAVVLDAPTTTSGRRVRRPQVVVT